MNTNKEKKMPIDQNQPNKEKAPRREQNSLDEAFMVAYCERPIDGKTAALIKAGFVGDNIPQEAYRMYKRLSAQIKERTSVLIESLDTLAASQLQSILKSKVEEVGYSNMNTAIKQGMDYAGRKPGDTLTVKTEEYTPEERRKEINRLVSERDNKGKELH